MFANAPGANRKPPPPVRRVVVTADKKSSSNSNASLNGSNGQRRVTSSPVRSLAARKGAHEQHQRSSSISRPPNGSRTAALNGSARSTSLSTPAQALAAMKKRASPAVSRSSSTFHTPTPPPRQAKKRKVSPAVAAFSESSSDESEEECERSAKRRMRTGELEPDFKRQMRDKQGWIPKEMDGEDEWAIIHGADLTAGNEKEFSNPFAAVDADGKESERIVVELQYPSNCPPERFELVLPREADGYNALDDIEESVHNICQNYFPDAQASKHADELNGFRQRLKRARNHKDAEGLVAVLKDFNELVKTNVEDGTIAKHLDNLHSLPLPLVERILNQVYVRTVSPKVHLLKQYENGTDNVYGEILPRFAHEVFQHTSLNSSQVFVDLGSGVGNVVLQAALQCGCEAWGTEMMPNPSSLAAAQLAEFNARCKRWGIAPGRVTLRPDDFLSSAPIHGALARASCVLINNKAFTPPLNNALTDLFLELRDGCRIVSLKSFVPDNWEIKPRNDQDVRNLLRVEKKFYGTRSVSWTNDGGDYYIATKDEGRLREWNARRAKGRGQ